MIFYLPLLLALVCLALSMRASMANPRHETVEDQKIRHSIATTLGVWAIVFLLAGIYLR